MGGHVGCMYLIYALCDACAHQPSNLGVAKLIFISPYCRWFLQKCGCELKLTIEHITQTKRVCMMHPCSLVPCSDNMKKDVHAIMETIQQTPIPFLRTERLHVNVELHKYTVQNP